MNQEPGALSSVNLGNFEANESLRSFFLSRFMLATLSLALLTAPAAACEPKALGTSRTLTVGTKGGVAVGLKTYPQTLALADHEVVLTFDDGPWPGTTGHILDALKAECVEATFFVVGRNAQAYPALTRRELAEGHTIGHHSMNHPARTLRNLDFTAAQNEINQGIRADDIAAYGSAEAEPRVPFFRYPGFADSSELNSWLKSRDIAIFGADLWASDWNPMTPAEELQLVLRRLERQKRGIILFHDTKMQTAAMLPQFLRALKDGGYHVVHLVAGTGTTETRPAPAGWQSETEKTLQRLWSKPAKKLP